MADSQRHRQGDLERALYERPRPGKVASLDVQHRQRIVRWRVAHRRKAGSRGGEKMSCVAELDEEYIRRMENILAVYEKPLSEQEPVVGVDEKPVVLHQDVRPPQAMKLGRVARRDEQQSRKRRASLAQTGPLLPMPTKVDSADSSTARVPVLDGIRGLAICLVLSWHTIFQFPLANHPYVARLASLGRLSWSGVDLFFVLSGFLIGGILLDAAKAQRYFAPFYIRRAHRILPLYGLVLLLVFSVTYLCHHLGLSGSWTESSVPLVYYPTFLQNYWMAKHDGFGSYNLGVTWSLAVEEQFYLTLPLIIRYVSRSRLWWIVAGMIAGAPFLRIFLIHSVPNGVFAAYVLMPCRADALGWGIAAALIKRNQAVWETILRRRAYLYVGLGGIAVGVAAVLLSRFRPFTDEGLGLEYSLLAALYFLLLISVLINRKLERVFSMKALCYMGTIAYGLYLLHFPIIGAVGNIVSWIHPRQSGLRLLFELISGVVLATAVSAISWEYLEKPLIKRGHRYGYGQERRGCSSRNANACNEIIPCCR